MLTYWAILAIKALLVWEQLRSKPIRGGNVPPHRFKVACDTPKGDIKWHLPQLVQQANLGPSQLDL